MFISVVHNGVEQLVPVNDVHINRIRSVTLQDIYGLFDLLCNEYICKITKHRD